MAKPARSADARSVKSPALTIAFALVTHAQPLQESAAAQLASVERQLRSLTIQGRSIGRAASSPAQAPGGFLSGLGVTPWSASLETQRASIQRQLASIPARPAPAPGSHANPAADLPPAPPLSPDGQALLAPPPDSFSAQIQSASVQPRLFWPPPRPPVPILDCAPMPAAQLAPLFRDAASAYGLDPLLLRAVAQRESGYNPCAVSPVGAMGLMQLMPATAAMLGVEDPFDAGQSILGGARFLRFLLDRYQNDLPLALSAYNAGPGAVERHGGIPPFAETRDYVSAILRALGQFVPKGAPAPPSPVHQ